MIKHWSHLNYLRSTSLIPLKVSLDRATSPQMHPTTSRQSRTLYPRTNRHKSTTKVQSQRQGLIQISIQQEESEHTSSTQSILGPKGKLDNDIIHVCTVHLLSLSEDQ